MVFVLHGQAFGYAQGIYLCLLILVAVEQTCDQITSRLVAQRVAPAVRVILSQTQAFGDGVIDRNDGVLAAGIAVAATATMQLFVCTPDILPR